MSVVAGTVALANWYACCNATGSAFIILPLSCGLISKIVLTAGIVYSILPISTEDSATFSSLINLVTGWSTSAWSVTYIGLPSKDTKSLYESDITLSPLSANT